jgi:hypothetical protein
MVFWIYVSNAQDRLSTKGKSVVLFSANASDIDREEVRGELEIAKETMNGRYLDLPAHVGRTKGNT